MEDIQKPNFQALFKFTRQVKNDLAEHNGNVKMANVNISYSWDSGNKIVKTQTLISLDNHPFAKLLLIEKDWLNAEDFFVEFQTGYNDFSFNEETNSLVIKNEKPSKMGSYYCVEITEI